MSQNPFDQQQQPQQQQNPFGQAPQQNPFGQQQQSFGGSASGFQQPMQPKKSGGGAGRCMIIGIGVVLACCILCCVGSVGLAFSFKGSTMAVVWAGSVGTGDYSTSVCPGSQAERFSQQYDDDVSTFTLTAVEESGDVVTLTGDVNETFGGTREDVLVMTISSEEDASFPGFGCISTIRLE